MRVTEHPILGPLDSDARRVTITVDGKPISAMEGGAHCGGVDGCGNSRVPQDGHPAQAQRNLLRHWPLHGLRHDRGRRGGGSDLRDSSERRDGCGDPGRSRQVERKQMKQGVDSSVSCLPAERKEAGRKVTHKAQVAVIGAGPAGLSAALEIAKSGGRVVVFDENDRPGGQLFKQIHKFFGSSHHGAGIRGYKLGEQLLADCRDHGVDIQLETAVYGCFPGNELGTVCREKNRLYKAEKILMATGASERPLAFSGWDLPGVMGAGAAQTMININRVLPGKKIVMVGSGNVGLVVSFQLLQAGAEVVAIVEGLPHINGYAVHANKVMRAGVPIYPSHTVVEAKGTDSVQSVVIAQVGPGFQVIPCTQKELDADTVCLAVGLTPSIELLKMAGVQLTHIPKLGGYLPLHGEDMRTTNPDIYIAGDVSGIEEASTAMEEGRLAGVSIAASLGLISGDEAKKKCEEINTRIGELRLGTHGDVRRDSKAEILRRYAAWQAQR